MWEMSLSSYMYFNIQIWIFSSKSVCVLVCVCARALYTLFCCFILSFSRFVHVSVCQCLGPCTSKPARPINPATSPSDREANVSNCLKDLGAPGMLGLPPPPPPNLRPPSPPSTRSFQADPSWACYCWHEELRRGRRAAMFAMRRSRSEEQ